MLCRILHRSFPVVVFVVGGIGRLFNTFPPLEKYSVCKALREAVDGVQQSTVLPMSPRKWVVSGYCVLAGTVF
jgi:hypothetical protein